MIGLVLDMLGRGAAWVWLAAPLRVTLLLLAVTCGLVAVLLVPRDGGSGRLRHLAGTAGLTRPPREELRADVVDEVPGPELADVVWLDERGRHD